MCRFDGVGKIHFEPRHKANTQDVQTEVTRAPTFIPKKIQGSFDGNSGNLPRGSRKRIRPWKTRNPTWWVSSPASRASSDRFGGPKEWWACHQWLGGVLVAFPSTFASALRTVSSQEDSQGLLPTKHCKISDGGGTLTVVNVWTSERTAFRVARQHKPLPLRENSGG